MGRENANPPNGRYVRAAAGSATCRAFVPNPLPPEITWDIGMVSAVSASDRAIGQLSSIGRLLPNPHLLIAPFMRKEAVQSSRIEGTQASVDDLYLFEASAMKEPPGSDVREVYNYVSALDYGIERSTTLPFSRRMMCELHRILMTGVRGQDRYPGEFRKVQNWIGTPGSTIEEATYIPPPPPEMNQTLDHFEQYLNAPSELPPLVRLAIIHYQFEAIHPFVDGNGRIGRLIVVLSLCMEGILPGPLLYISDSLEKHREEYYAHLLTVSTRGCWSEWIKFFLRAATEAARDGTLRAQRLIELQARYRHLFAGVQSATTIALVELLFDSPAFTAGSVAKRLEVTPTTSQRAIRQLIKEGIVQEVTGKERNRIYVAKEILKAISDPMIA